jgi:UDP-sugar pyrophosphorylase
MIIRKSLATVLSAAVAVAAMPIRQLNAVPLSAVSQIPARLGTVSESFAGSTGKKIILIQDLHAHEETQRKIASILGMLDKQGQLGDRVAIEGASGPWSLSLMASYPKQARREELFDFLLKEAGLTGSEWFALNTGRPNLLVGVDSGADYTAQRALFNSGRGARETIARQLANVEDSLQRLSERSFDRRLKAWQTYTSRFEAGQLAGKGYYKKLVRLTDGTELPSEVQSLKAALAAAANATADLASSDILYTDLRRFGQGVGLALANDLARQNAVKAIYAVNLTKRLLEQRVTLEEVRQIASRQEEAAKLVHQLIANSGQPSLFTTNAILELIRQSTDFYVAALVRDEPITQNTLNLLGDRDSLVLIVGGFHTQGITRELKRRKISYEVVTPSITTDFTSDDETRYANRLAGQPVDLSLMQGSGALPSRVAVAKSPNGLQALLPEGQKMTGGDVGMFGAESVAWFSRYRNLRGIKQEKTPEALKSLGLQAVPSAEAAPHPLVRAINAVRSGPLDPEVGPNIRDIFVIEGEIRPESFGDLSDHFILTPDTIDRYNRQFILRTNVPEAGADLNDIYVFQASLAPYLPYLPGGELATPETAAIFAHTLLQHENDENRRVYRRRSGRAVVQRHDDLVAYGLSFDRVKESLEKGTPNDWLDDLQDDTGIDWRAAGQTIQRKRRELPSSAEIARAEQQLRSLGMDNLFPDGVKPSMLEQVVQLDRTVPGGITGYHRNVSVAVQNALNNRSRFQGRVPLLPPTIDIDDMDGVQQNDSEFRRMERAGLAHLGRSAFVAVAGGLGKRLGYPHIKLGLPISLITKDTYFDWYVKNILAWQQRAGISKPSERIPFFIMISDDNEDEMVALLRERGYQRNADMDSGHGDMYWEKDDSLIILAQQSMSPVVDKEARFQIDPKDPQRLQVQPGGHGPIHALLARTELLDRWAAQGRDQVVFIQDTNASLTNIVPVVVQANVQHNAGMTFVGVPRGAGDNLGLVSLLADKEVVRAELDALGIHFSPTENPEGLFQVLKSHGIQPEDFSQRIIDRSKKMGRRADVANVEYLIAKPALQESIHPAGDFKDSTGLSPYPGNTNILVFNLNILRDAVRQTGGLMPLMIKFDGGTTGRGESNMQDISEAISEAGHRVQAVRFKNKNGFGFSTTKNSLAAAAKAQTDGKLAEAMSTSEHQHYLIQAQKLEKAGFNIEPPVEAVVKGVKIPVGARVMIMPNVADSVDELVEKFNRGRITRRSTLVLDGEGISAVRDLNLDGVLEVRIGPGVNLTIDHLTVLNSATDSLRELPERSAAPDELNVRGYQFERINANQARIIEVYEPGTYRLGASGKLERQVAPESWVRVKDRIGQPLKRKIGQPRPSLVRNQRGFSLMTTVSAIGVISVVAAVAFKFAQVKAALALLATPAAGYVLGATAIIGAIYWLTRHFNNNRQVPPASDAGPLKTHLARAQTAIPDLAARASQAGEAAVSQASSGFKRAFAFLGSPAQRQRREGYEAARQRLMWAAA